MARRSRNAELSEDASVMRNAFNADAKEFKEMLDRLSDESPEDRERRQATEGISKLRKVLGG